MCLKFSFGSLLLQVIQKNRKRSCLFSEVGDDRTRSTDGLLDTAIVFKLGKTAPCAKFLSGLDHKDMDFTLSTKCADKLLVLFVLAILSEAAETSRTAVKCFGALVESLL